MGCFTFTTLHYAARQSVQTYARYNTLLVSRQRERTNNKDKFLQKRWRNDKRSQSKYSRKTNISLVWSSYCLPVVKCFWWPYTVFWVWWPCSDGPRVCVCTHSCVASVQALSCTFKCCSWTKRYLGSAQMFIQLISCVSFSRHTQASRHTHAHAAEGHVQKTDSQMTDVLKERFNGKWKWKI